MTVLEQRAYEAIASMAKKDEPDYWEKLKHQAAISAMQGIVSNDQIMIELGDVKDISIECVIAETSNRIATALVEKLKEK